MSETLAHARPDAVDTPGSFEVHLQQSGVTLVVGAEETVLQALERVGVHVDNCCQQGICGSCMTTVLEGEPVHMDMCLSEADRNSNQIFTPCCSRAKGRLVLDL